MKSPTTLNVRVLAFIMAFPQATHSDFLKQCLTPDRQADFDMHKLLAANIESEIKYLKGETKND